jgi:hypothetical protein
MSDSDVADLVGFFLSAFAVGLISAFLIRVFVRFAGVVTR